MGEGTCNIDTGISNIYAISVTDCESMDENECNTHNGGGCHWDDEIDQCDFGGIPYHNLRPMIFVGSNLVILIRKMKNNLALTLSIVGIVVVVIATTVGASFVTKKAKS